MRLTFSYCFFSYCFAPFFKCVSSRAAVKALCTFVVFSLPLCRFFYKITKIRYGGLFLFLRYFSCSFSCFAVYFDIIAQFSVFFRCNTPRSMLHWVANLVRFGPEGGDVMRRKMLLSYFSILLAFCAVIFVFVLRTVYSMVQGNLIETSSQIMQRWSTELSDAMGFAHSHILNLPPASICRNCWRPTAPAPPRATPSRPCAGTKPLPLCCPSTA